MYRVLFRLKNAVLVLLNFGIRDADVHTQFAITKSGWVASEFTLQMTLVGKLINWMVPQPNYGIDLSETTIRFEIDL